MMSSQELSVSLIVEYLIESKNDQREGRDSHKELLDVGRFSQVFIWRKSHDWAKVQKFYRHFSLNQCA